MAASADALKKEERRRFNRKLVLLVHVLAAFFTALIYFSDLDLRGFHYWGRTAGTTALLIAAPPLLPYIISAVHSWRMATYDRLRVAAFLLVLVAGAFGTGCVPLGAFDLTVGRFELLEIFMLQAGVYFLSAEFLFDVD